MLELLALGLAAVAVIVVLQILADRTGLPAAALLTVAGRLPDTSLRILERELDHEERIFPGPGGH